MPVRVCEVRPRPWAEAREDGSLRVAWRIECHKTDLDLYVSGMVRGPNAAIEGDSWYLPR
jgi:hypothetical protein